MVIEVEQKTLKKALAALGRVVPSRSPNPLLTHAHLRVNGEGLLFRGTDGVVELELGLPARVEGEGEREVLVPREALAILEGNASERTLLEVEEARLRVRAGKFQAELRLAPAAGYPAPEFPGGEGVSLPREVLGEAVGRVRYAAGKEEYRPIFRGVNLEFSQEGLRAVASDGYRLALYDAPHPFPFQRQVVAPARELALALALLEGLEVEEVTLRLEKHVLGLEGEGEALSLRLALNTLAGDYPDYRRVIPQTFVARVEVETRALKEALRRLEALAEEKNHRVDLSLLGEGELLLRAEGDYGEGEERVPALVEGKPLTLAINGEYLLEALPREERTTLQVSGATTPLVVAPGDGGGYRAVVVPLRV